jgi:hypothetical protein
MPSVRADSSRGDNRGRKCGAAEAGAPDTKWHGVVARSRGETSLFGSVLDIAADRTYELILWVCFADLRMISVVIPLMIIARTTLTDAFRSIGVGQGTAPFAQHRTALSRFLVGSSWMRSGYAVPKVATFCSVSSVACPSSSARSAGTGGFLQPPGRFD